MFTDFFGIFHFEIFNGTFHIPKILKMNMFYGGVKFNHAKKCDNGVPVSL